MHVFVQLRNRLRVVPLSCDTKENITGKMVTQHTGSKKQVKGMLFTLRIIDFTWPSFFLKVFYNHV